MLFLAIPTSIIFWVSYAIISIAWAAFYFKISTDRFQIPKFYILVEVVGMIVGFIWLYYVSGVLIDVLNFLGVISKLNATYLALTVIAVGNALPDTLITIALA